MGEGPFGFGFGEHEEPDGVEVAVRCVPVMEAQDDAARRARDQKRRRQCGSLDQRGVIVARADHEQAAGSELGAHRTQCPRHILIVEQMWDRVVAGEHDVEVAGDLREIAEIGLAATGQADRLRPDAAGTVQDVLGLRHSVPDHPIKRRALGSTALSHSSP